MCVRCLSWCIAADRVGFSIEGSYRVQLACIGRDLILLVERETFPQYSVLNLENMPKSVQMLCDNRANCMYVWLMFVDVYAIFGRHSSCSALDIRICLHCTLCVFVLWWQEDNGNATHEYEHSRQTWTEEPRLLPAVQRRNWLTVSVWSMCYSCLWKHIQACYSLTAKCQSSIFMTELLESVIILVFYAVAFINCCNSCKFVNAIGRGHAMVLLSSEYWITSQTGNHLYEVSYINWEFLLVHAENLLLLILFTYLCSYLHYHGLKPKS